MLKLTKDFESIYHKAILKSHESSINIFKRGNKFHYMMFFASIFFITWHIIVYSSYFNLITIGIWVFSFFLNLFYIKRNNKKIKEYKLKYDEELKNVDYKKYIREKRVKKLKRIKFKRIHI
jgi:hypothetical protein